MRRISHQCVFVVDCLTISHMCIALSASFFSIHYLKLIYNLPGKFLVSSCVSEAIKADGAWPKMYTTIKVVCYFG